MRHLNRRTINKVWCNMPRICQVVSIVGGVCACILTVSACSSTSSSATNSTTTVVTRDSPIFLVPNIHVGEIGWCVVEPNGYECLEGITRTPVISESWSRSEPPPVSRGYAITTSQVRTVSVAGRHVPTRSEETLPPGLRVVTVEAYGGRSQSESGNGRARRLHFVPFNARGEVVAERLTSREPGKFSVEAVSNPERPTTGACRIELAAPLTGLVAEAANVAVGVKPYRSAVSGAYASCANTLYQFGDKRLIVAIMLNASDPGATPGDLPGMRPLDGHPGFIETLGIEGEMVGRRLPGAWLVVSGRGVLTQRLKLLEDIRATLNLPEGPASGEGVPSG
jgi:hypothetical protein